MNSLIYKNIECIDSIFKRINSTPGLRKECIDWNYLCYIEDKEHTAAYYVMQIALALINEGYKTYPDWKNKMLEIFNFLNKYPYSYCSEKELQTIVDGAWNSYIHSGINSETIWYKAWKKLPFYKKWIMNFTSTRIAGWTAFMCQTILAISVDFIFLFYISIALIISLYDQRKDYSLDFVFPLSMIFFNYIIQTFGFSFENGYNFFILMHEIQLYILNYSYIVLFLCFLIFYVNRHNATSFKKARRDKLIREFSF